MISFDLKCSLGHVFEGWFSSSQDYADQQARSLVSCPVCGDETVSKALMAPNVGAKGNGSAVSDEPPQLTPERMMVMLRHMRREVEQNADNVGTAFAEEARKIHYGETDPRSIYGESTPEESEELKEEGIDFLQMPWIQDQDH